MKHTNSGSEARLSHGYYQRLAERFGGDSADELNGNGWSTLASSFDDDRTVTYVQVGKPKRGDVHIVGGLTEGVINQAPFLAALANKGYRVTMADHGARGLLRDPYTGRRSALFTRAADSLDILRQHPAKAVVTHSMGSLVLSKMATHVINEDEGILTNVQGVLLAPAGMYDAETLTSIAPRFMSKLGDESGSRVKTFSFPDTEGDMLKAGTRNLLSTPLRSVREVQELVRDRVIVDQLRAGGMTRLAVLGFGQDPLFPDRVIGDRAMADGLLYSVPIAGAALLGEGARGDTNATHDDGQFYPERVAGAVASVVDSVNLLS